jgi:histidinol-phosphate aminotransferase
VSEPPRLNSIARDFRPYQPSQLACSADGRAYLLARNETPFGPLPSVISAITAAAAQSHRYPDPLSAELAGELAGRLDVPADNLVVGAGSVAFIQAILAAVAEPGANVIYAWRSFELYSLLAGLAGLASVRVPLVAERHDLEAMSAAVDARTRLVMVCNPNNPTGTAVTKEALVSFLDSVPAGCLVVLDEAYGEYMRCPGPGAELFRDRPNLIVLRTFSKAYGLAGLRVGYMLAHSYITSRIRNMCLPFGVSHVAQAAAVASLRAERELLDRVTLTVAERTRVRAALLARGYVVPPSEANFVWIRLGRETTSFAARCAHAGVNVQPYPGEGVRVTIGSAEDNEAFLAATAAGSATLQAKPRGDS